MTQMTQSEWARSQGFSRQYVGQLIQSGRIELIDGMIDAEAADQMLMQSRDYNRQQRRKGNEETERLNHLMLKSNVKAAMAKSKMLTNKAEREEGEWMLVSEVKTLLFNRHQEVLKALLNISERTADQFAAMTDAHAIYMTINQEIRDAVEALVRDV